MKKSFISLVTAAAMILPMSIATYIDRTTHGNSTFCTRYDNGTVENIFQSRSFSERLTPSQIGNRVRGKMRGAFKARDAAQQANLDKRTGCNSRVYKSFSKTRRYVEGQVKEHYSP